MDSRLPHEVQMQYMRPQQLEDRGRSFPVVYLPFGLIEWHGRHLPLGTDALKAHAVLVKTAERFGGVVYPPFYLHNGFENSVPLLTEVFHRIKQTGFRVMLAVSGHNVDGMLEMIDAAMAPAIADGTCTGAALWEMSLSRGSDCDSDHAAKWETSDIQFFYPHLVDLAALGEGPISRETYTSKAGEPQSGIGGEDPRVHASAQVGEKCMELASTSLGEKAKELLNTLPPEQRSFGLERVSPASWWYI